VIAEPPHKTSSSDRSSGSGPDLRPLVARTRGSATEGVYGLILATSVIALWRRYEGADAGPLAVAVLVTAVVFWLAHVYARMLGSGVSHAGRPTRSELAHALREHGSIVEVVVPLVLVLCLGAIGVVPDHAAVVAATVMALVELAAAGGYAAMAHGASRRETLVSAAIALALGLLVVSLKVIVH
jgi:hypothetical protein